MVVIQPDHVKSIVDYDAMNTTMLVYAQFKLPSRVGLVLFIEAVISIRPPCTWPVMGMGANRFTFIGRKLLHGHRGNVFHPLYQFPRIAFAER